MEIQEPQSIENLHSDLENQFNDLVKLNERICTSANHFSIVNSQLESFFAEVENIDNLENEEQDIFHSNTNSKNSNKIIRSKKEFIAKFNHLSKHVADFISIFSTKYLSDDFTTENLQKIRERFFYLSEQIRNKNQTKQSQNNYLFTKKIPKSVLFEVQTVKTTFDNTKIVFRNPEETFKEDEDIYPPLNKFYTSLQTTYEHLIEKAASQYATNDDSLVYQKHPNPRMLSENVNFKKYLQIHKKLRGAISQLISELQPYHTKIHRKQQQISAIITNITTVLSTMDNTLQRFQNERDRYTSALTVYQKVDLIDNANKDYEFFNPSIFTDDVYKFLNDENRFLKDVDDLIHFTKSRSTIIVSNVNDEKTLALNQLDHFIMTLNNYNKYIMDCVKNFEYKKDKNQLPDKLARKKNLIANFNIKYKRIDKKPSRELIAARSAYKDAVRSKEKNGFEIINTDIFQSINSLSKIEKATSQFSSIFNLFKEHENGFEDEFLSKAKDQWEIELRSEFEQIIEKNKAKLEELKTKYKLETEKNECMHPKTVCLATCGHCFCDQCLDTNLHACPKCNTPFAENEIIHINW